MREYQGQLWGGPGHGNIVSATVKRVRYQSWTQMWLDGREGHIDNTKVKGEYIWNPKEGRFDWKGPGADGDTLERLRLR